MSTRSCIRTLMPVLAVIILFSAAGAGAAEIKAKPQLPVRIAIEPVQKALKAQGIKPGDIVELRITASTMKDADEVRIDAELQDGAELVSGATSWRGKAAKGAPNELVLGVRAPAGGTGTVKATVRVFRGGKQIMKKETRYFLGGEPSGPGRIPAGAVIKKDAKGRDIVEY